MVIKDPENQMNIDSWNRTHESCLLIANPDNKQQIIKHRHFLNEQLLSFRIKEDDYLVQLQLISRIDLSQ